MAFTITETGRRNLGGGALIVFGTVAADTGNYATGGLVTDPTFASLDTIGGGLGVGSGSDAEGRREPHIILFADGDGYKWEYDRGTALLMLFALQLSGAAQANLAYGEHTAAAVAAAVGTDVKFVAFWFANIPE